MATITEGRNVGLGEPSAKRRSWLLRGLPWLFAAVVIGAAIVLVVFSLSASTPSAKTVADRWATALAHGDPNKLVELYAKNATWHDAADGTNLSGINGVKEGWALVNLPNFHVRSVEVMAAGGRGAAVRYTMFGPSSPFSGKPWTVSIVSVLEISKGEITSETLYYNLEALK